MPDSTFLDSTELVLNMGPQHPSTHGVLRVILKLDGEKVLGTECVIGYLHRGVEKIAENRTYTMFNPYVDRMDYVAAVSNGLGYCEARGTVSYGCYSFRQMGAGRIRPRGGALKTPTWKHHVGADSRVARRLQSNSLEPYLGRYLTSGPVELS